MTTCKRCGREAEAGEARCAGCGCLLPGHELTLRHGGRRRRALTAQEARGSELFQQWAQDLGGLDALSVGQQEVLAGVVAAVFIRQTCEGYLAKTRTALSSDKARRALETFFRADDSVRRGAALLGLERRQRQIDPAEAIRRAIREADE